MGVIVALLVGLLGTGAAGALAAPGEVQAAGPGPAAEGVGAAGEAAGGGRAGPVAVALVFLGCSVVAVLWGVDVLRPGSFRRRGGREVGDLPWGVWVAAGFGVFLAGALGAAASLGLSAAGDAAQTDGATTIADQARTGLAASLASVLAGVAALVFLAPEVPRTAGLRPRWWDVPIGLAAFVVAAPVLWAVSVLTTLTYALVMGEPPDPVGHDTLRVIVENAGDPWIWGLIGAAVVGAPVAEELIYRVFLQSGMLRLTGSHWWAIGITSLIFTAVHAGAVPLYAMPVLFALGACMGLAYERTARIGVPIAMHMAFNAVNVALTTAQ